ncbi:MAG: radical SAM protein [Polyangiaceae bacterium]
MNLIQLGSKTASTASRGSAHASADQAQAPRPRPEGRLNQGRLQQLAAEGRALAAELAPTLTSRDPRKKELKRRARSVQTALGNYRENRRRARAGREDFLPLYFIWTALRPCNFRCSYCDDHRGAKYPELDGHGKLDTARARRLLQIMRTRTPSVYFAGGEPTLRKDLPELVRTAKELAYHPIVVNTNGSLFHSLLRKPEWRTFLGDVDILVVSLDALDEALLSSMWRTRQPGDVIRNLFMLHALSKQLGFKLMVNTVIQPGHIADARAVLRLADQLGISFCPVPQNRGPSIDPAVLQDPDYPALVDEILAMKRAGRAITGSLRMNERLLRAAPLDCRNTLKPHVDHDGHLLWPCKAAVNVSPERLDVLAFDDVDSLYAEATRRVDPTRFHGPAKNQCGADCNWAQNYTTDAYAHGLAHPLSLLRDVLGFVA